MSETTAPEVECERHHASVCVPDVEEAVRFYTEKLGFRPGFTWGDPPTFAGVNLGEVQQFLERGQPNPDGCALFFVVGDADALHDYHAANGVEILMEPGDREYGLRDYVVRDLAGYRLSFGHYIYTAGPPIVIERVEVTVRLERRLAALMQDLAVHQGRELGETLEEILLHTCDGVTPHTRSTVRYIQKLKEKHGIDYDTHGSYRFVETAEGSG